MPRGRAMGYVMRVSEEDRMSMSRAMLIDTVAVALAGRAAEEIVFNDVTTGAAKRLSAGDQHRPADGLELGA